MRWNLILSGFLLLLLGSYVDNIRGPLLPLLTRELGLAYGKVGLMLVIGGFASILATIVLMRWRETWGDRNCTLIVLGMLALSAFFSPFVTGISGLVIFSFLIGLAIAGAGACCNLLVYQGTDSAYRGKVLSGLHSMYGVGSFLGPAVFSFFLVEGFRWPITLQVLLPAIVLLGSYLLYRIPNRSASQPSPIRFHMRPVYFLVLAIFVTYVAAEVLCSMWMTAYLVERENLPIETASQYLSTFFLLLAGTRLLCFFFLKPGLETLVLVGSLVASMTAFLFGLQGYLSGFALAGTLGPFFPLLLARLSRNYPRDMPTLTLAILLSIHLAISQAHFVVAKLTDAVGIGLAYRAPVFLMCLAIVLLSMYLRWEAKTLSKPARAPR